LVLSESGENMMSLSVSKGIHVRHEEIDQYCSTAFPYDWQEWERKQKTTACKQLYVSTCVLLRVSIM